MGGGGGVFVERGGGVCECDIAGAGWGDDGAAALVAKKEEGPRMTRNTRMERH